MKVKTGFINNNKFPLVVTPEDPAMDVVNWAQESKGQIREWLNAYGCILFRGFGVNNIEDFELLATASTSNNWVKYLEATSPRDVVKSNTATSTKYQNDKIIFYHNEKSYSGIWPLNLFFYCDVAPQIGGETPLADCRAIYNDMPWLLGRKFKKNRLMYVRKFSNNMGIPWKKAFDVETKEEMEAYCRENYIDSLEWDDDGTPILKYIRNTSLRHPITKDMCWFNHGTFFNVHSLEPELKEFFLRTVGQDNLPYNTFYGSGEEISEKEIATLRALYQKHSVAFAWHKGDVLLIDNMLVAHGRNPFEGPRSILVTMTDPVDYKNVDSF